MNLNSRQIIVVPISYSINAILLLIIPLSIWYYIYYVRKLKSNVLDWYAYLFNDKSEYLEPAYKFTPTRFRVIFPFLFPFLAFIILNVDYSLAAQDAANFTKAKDLLAWFSYVIFHLTVSILAAVYLYVFHPPGTLKCFAFALGFQIIVAVFSHLLPTMAPPWLIHVYDYYDVKHKGYAAGLTGVDYHLGTNLNTDGFSQSPIGFGCVPSVYSATAVQCFLFLIFNSRGSYLRQSGAEDDRRDFRANSCRRSIERSADIDLERDFDSVQLLAYDDTSSDTLVGSDKDDDDEDEDDDDNNDDNDSRCSDLELEDDIIVSSSLPGPYTGPGKCENIIYRWLFHTGYVPKILGTTFLVVQWWATMYLDHHFRFDLLAGMFYAMLSYLVVTWYILQPKIAKWCKVRLEIDGDEEEVVDGEDGKTMGMRVFEDKGWGWFFDPFA
ncbi:DEKNAAC103776 [Brettanomyces naardenensis]|uniref:DEKNAAC103776 n=1 Tax=Brettanomyces naardenensis TaxID=13370 RepID=A0A448YP55_BRENA|nr:DEKNAAC103776 [Brettanomyces naardenensis]